jgi:hypothetical protein
MEMETETDNTWTWTWTRPRSRTWNLGNFCKYFLWCNCPYSAIWNALEISWRNFQWPYRLVAPLHHENDDMQILKNSYHCWNSFPNDVLAELGISVLGSTNAATRGMYSNWKLIYYIQNIV